MYTLFTHQYKGAMCIRFLGHSVCVMFAKFVRQLNTATTVEHGGQGFDSGRDTSLNHQVQTGSKSSRPLVQLIMEALCRSVDGRSLKLITHLHVVLNLRVRLRGVVKN
jgi:hypothetical protein